MSELTPYALCAVCVLLVGVPIIGYYGAVRVVEHGWCDMDFTYDDGRLCCQITLVEMP